MKQLWTIVKSYKILYLATLLNAGMFLVSSVGLLLDSRQLLGENIWLKPAKFGASIVIYLITMAALLSIYPYTKKRKQQLAWIFGGTMILEMPLLLIQVIRGVPSHFNISTPFNGFVFGAMGILIFLNSLGLIWMMITAFTKRLETSQPMQRAVQFAWVGMLISMAAGQLMISAMQHSVGVADGGVGIPITNWSAEGGDWRAVHFLGMHGIQLLPLMVYFLQDRIKSVALNRLVWISGVFYLLLIVFIFMRTQRGVPLFS